MFNIACAIVAILFVCWAIFDGLHHVRSALKTGVFTDKGVAVRRDDGLDFWFYVIVTSLGALGFGALIVAFLVIGIRALVKML